MTKDQFIIEKLGMCWHEKDDSGSRSYSCKKCNKPWDKWEHYPDLSTPDGMVWLANKMTATHFGDFGWWSHNKNISPIKYVLDPKLFMNDVAEWLGWEEKWHT